MKESDFNEHTTPPGGWCFRQPEFGDWTVQHPISKTLNQAVLDVVAVRKKNIAITTKNKLSTSPEAVKTEVVRFNRKRLGLNPDGAAPPFPESHRSFVQGAVGAVADRLTALQRAAQNTAVPIEWFKNGGMPVARELANKRAAICVVCPKHEKGEWYTVAAGEVIKKTIEVRSDIKLETDYDAQLQSCGVCGCLLRAKVHTPLNVIVEKTKPEVMAKFPPNCWITKSDQI